MSPYAEVTQSEVLQQQAPQQRVPANGADEAQQPVQIDEGGEELQQAAASASDMYHPEWAVESPLSAQQSRSTVSNAGQGSISAAPVPESAKPVPEPGSSPQPAKFLNEQT